jgi:hypothetical protein
MNIPARPDQRQPGQPAAALGAGFPSSKIFRGRLVVITGSGPPGTGLYVYSPAQAAGDLIASIAAAGGTDGIGNEVVQGIAAYYTDASGNLWAVALSPVLGGLGWANLTTLLEGAPNISASGNATTGVYLQLVSGESAVSASQAQLQLFDSVSSGNGAPLAAFNSPLALANVPVPGSLASQALLYAVAGQLKYVSTDGNAYNTGRSTIQVTANQTISSTAASVIGANSNPMTWDVVAGTYLIQGMVNWAQGAAAVAQDMGFSGPAISQCRIRNEWALAVGFGETTNLRETNTTGGLILGASPAFAIGAAVDWSFDGCVTFSAAGTFSIEAAEGTAGDSFTIGAGSFASLLPVS